MQILSQLAKDRRENFRVQQLSQFNHLKLDDEIGTSLSSVSVTAPAPRKTLPTLLPHDLLYSPI